MWTGVAGRVWLHVCLILGDPILAARRKWGGVDDGLAPLISPEDGDVPLGDGPPAWRAGGCKGKRGNRCAWLRCKHEGYKIRLAYEKYQSDAQVLKKAGNKIRFMSKDQRQKHLEEEFLMKKITGVHMYAAVDYALKGEAKKCVWASDGLTQFEAWLKNLLPTRHACVKEVVDLHPPNEQICSEILTDDFKRALHRSCEEDLEPRDEKGDVEAENLRDKTIARRHQESESTASTGLAAAGMFSAATFAVVGAVGALGVGALAILPAAFIFLVTAPVIAYAICTQMSKHRLAKRLNALKTKKIK